MQLTLGQAAKQAGVSKPTLSRAINEGRISAKKREDGSYGIDPAELMRWKEAYSHRHTKVAQTVTPPETPDILALQVAAASAAAELSALKTVLAEKERRISDLENDRDAWRTQAGKLALPAPQQHRGGLFGWFGGKRAANS